MARKKMIGGDLFDPDTKRYWEKLLIKEGLGMGVGTSSKLSYGGSSNDLDQLSGLQTGGVRKVAPKKTDM